MQEERMTPILTAFPRKFTDKNLLFLKRSRAKFALCVNKACGPIYGVLGLWYGGGGCERLEKVRIGDGLS
jgi:hypothetical protein